MQLSALKAHGIDTFCSQVEQFERLRRTSGEFAARRKNQSLAWLWDLIQARLQTDFKNHPAVRGALPHALCDVSEGRVAPSAAARTLLGLFEDSAAP